MRESVQLDLLGQIRLDFHPTALIFVHPHHPFPTRIRGRRRAINTPIPYTDIHAIETLTRHQWWLLVPGLFFTLMGPLWTASALLATPPNWPALTISLLWFLFLGIVPLLLLARGRPHLAIFSPTHVILLPIDRKQKKIRRILGLLYHACDPDRMTRNFQHPDFSPATFDLRPPTGATFYPARLTLITTLAAIYGLANLLHARGFRTLPLLLLATLLLIALTYIAHKLRKQPPNARK